MKINKSLLILLFLFICCLPAFTQLPDADVISENRLRDHVLFLASDSLKGRGINSPGIEIAAGYLENELRQMNLSSPEAGFFQHFVLSSLSPDKENSFFRVVNKKGKERKSIKDFIAFHQNSNTVDISGELIFAGFGLDHPAPESIKTGGNYYQGKTVIYSAGTPESFSDGSTYRFDNSLERKKMKELQQAGAKALILVTSIHDTANATYNQLQHLAEREKFTLGRQEPAKLPDIFIIKPETADRLAGRKSDWGKALRSDSENKEQENHSFKTDRIHIRSVLKEKKVGAKNVIGMVEGSDPLLKDECVVFVAHYDHLGTGTKGEIFNGADDNASGVATLLELAAVFSQLPEKTKRSMLFLFPSAEETGLFGSEYYSQDPVFPMKKTVACINLDMVGRVAEPGDSVEVDSPKRVKDFEGIYALVNGFSPDLKAITAKACSLLNLEPDFTLKGHFFYISDHYHFHKNQVPVLNLSTGYTADYHKPTDTADRIRTDKMKRVAQLCYLVATELGNMEH